MSIKKLLAVISAGALVLTMSMNAMASETVLYDGSGLTKVVVCGESDTKVALNANYTWKAGDELKITYKDAQDGSIQFFTNKGWWNELSAKYGISGSGTFEYTISEDDAKGINNDKDPNNNPVSVGLQGKNITITDVIVNSRSIAVSANMITGEYNTSIPIDNSFASTAKAGDTITIDFKVLADKGEKFELAIQETSKWGTLENFHYVAPETTSYTAELTESDLAVLSNNLQVAGARIAVMKVTYAECTHESTTVKNAKEATCTENGYTGDQVCSNCGQVLEEGEVIPALGHNYKDGSCTVCNEKDPDYTAPSSPNTGATLPFAVLSIVALASGVVLVSKKRS